MVSEQEREPELCAAGGMPAGFERIVPHLRGTLKKYDTLRDDRGRYLPVEKRREWAAREIVELMRRVVERFPGEVDL